MSMIEIVHESHRISSVSLALTWFGGQPDSSMSRSSFTAWSVFPALPHARIADPYVMLFG